MLTLIETLTGFAAIMLMLSLLVKTLTSVIKNQWDYYSDNLQHEVRRLVLETTGRTWDAILQDPNTSARVKNVLMDIHWERLGEEILSPKHMEWLLQQLDANAIVADLDSRLKIHVANVKYTFEMRMKNLALAVGLALCLLCNINALTIWKSLYTDQQLRATFANSYAQKASDLADADAKADQAGAGVTKEQLDSQLTDFRANMKGFLTDVSFGVGRIWKQPCPPLLWLYEFLGSLLTGILVSIGAPYWHDFLQTVSSLRSFFGAGEGQKAPAKA